MIKFLGVQIFFLALSVSLHTIAIYLLCAIKKQKNFNEIHRIHLLALSVTTWAVSLSSIATRLSAMYGNHTVMIHAEILSNCLFYLTLQMTMNIIVFDHLLLLHYGIRHHVIWSKGKAIALLTLGFLIGLTVSIMIWFKFSSFRQVRSFLAMYIWPISEWTFFLLILLTFVYSTAKYRVRKTTVTCQMTTSTTLENGDQAQQTEYTPEHLNNSFSNYILPTKFTTSENLHPFDRNFFCSCCSSRFCVYVL